MNIGIDHDETYSRDPELWEAFIKCAQSRGHKLWCITKREPQLALTMSIPVIYTSRRAKIPVVQSQGIHIDIWIDDNPAGIIFNDGAQVQVSG